MAGALVSSAALMALLLALAAPADAASFPPGFRDTALPFDGLFQPTVVRFASDGSVFVGEREGKIKRFSSIADTSAGRTVLDITDKVNSNGDRGLLGLAVDPRYPEVPRIYALYTTEKALPGTRVEPPGGTWNDDCPNPPGATEDGCVVAAQLSRVTLDADFAGTEQSMVEDWCQQYPSHSIGTLEFGLDGYLYAGAGDGANFNVVDYGQLGGESGAPISPGPNPCKDPDREGGALRSQDVETPNDPTTLDGSIIRISPDTGEGAPNNPLSGDANRRRILAYGFRNPFRFTFKPNSSEMWLTDVGWNRFEELNRIPDPAGGQVHNFGWPCYEGRNRQTEYTAAQLALCGSLDPSEVTAPVFTYSHGVPAFPGDTCAPNLGSSPSGIRFTPPNSPYPSDYDGGLFISDYSRECMWFIPKSTASDQPDPTRIRPFARDLEGAVNLEVGPGGDLYYTDIMGSIRRIRYTPGNQAPVARLTMQAPHDVPHSDDPPLDVDFDGSTSSDADDIELTYQWDLDGDGAYDDFDGPNPPIHTYTERDWYTVGLRVSDPLGASDTATIDITTGNTPPRATVKVTKGDPWAAGDEIAFEATAVDAQDGPIPPSQMFWDVTLEHCTAPEACHNHPVTTLEDVDHGRFFAWDHDWPSFHRITLTVRDSDGLTTRKVVDLHPKESRMTVEARSGGAIVPGVRLDWNGKEDIAGKPATVIQNSRNILTAPTVQRVGADTFHLAGWSRPTTPGPIAGSVWYRAGAGSPTVVAEFDRAPRSVRAPRVLGGHVAGSLLTADDGDWVGVPAPAVARQWLRCDAAGGACADIPGANGATYVPTSADVGRRLRVAVGADSRTPEPPVAATSEPTAPIEPQVLSPRPPSAHTPKLSFSGTRRQAALRHNGLWIYIGCSVHPCKARATASVRVGSKRLSLRSSQRSIARPGKRTKVRLPLSRSQRRSLVRLKRGKRVHVAIDVTARGAETPTAERRRWVWLHR